jgi:nicotinamide-nucleotide amidase
VRARFKKLGYAKMPESNIGQAMIPEGFIVLRNLAGTAPGLLFSNGSKAFAILPGVPREMQWIVEDSLLKRLKKNFASNGNAVIRHRTLITTGIGESSLSELLGPIDALLEENVTLAFLPNVPILRLRISAHGISEREVITKIARVEKRIRAIAEKYIIGVDDETLERIVSDLLAKNKKTLSLAESCTGGMLAARITALPGASKIFLGGIVSYDDSIKTRTLGVEESVIEKHGAVSKETALAMAKGVRAKIKSNYALAITGLAGPTGGTEQKPVGTVWIAIADERGVEAFHFLFRGDRQIIRERSTISALELLRKRLLRLV